MFSVGAAQGEAVMSLRMCSYVCYTLNHGALWNICLCASSYLEPYTKSKLSETAAPALYVMPVLVVSDLFYLYTELSDVITLSEIIIFLFCTVEG